ncbi:hypothetical protein TMUPMC115_0333 [Tetragenococcus muriaticus PMC-11-5]|uniref:Uncharacterized protein n=1 Tax=Tetragenococcus muriaticus PMC-11-5 TaxID=1302649 RepID=A0A091CAC2_9ENTE|nr:hypothetical protein TMUPMC115_0333 [Tetragenococcus muriaticus PMC-11-5]
MIQAWHIGFDNAHRPSDQTIQWLLQRINPQDIYMNEGHRTVFFKEKRHVS